MNGGTVASRRRPRHVEVSVQPIFSPSLPEVRNQCQIWLQSLKAPIPLGKEGEIKPSFVPELLRQSCVTVAVRDDDDDDDDDDQKSISRGAFTTPQPSRRGNCFVPGDPFLVHAYVLSNEASGVEELEPPGGDDEWTAGCDSTALPHATMDGLWESLIFDSHVKRHLLDYAQSALLFSDRGVSAHVVRWNRILLLHGVPGTGKTSLCRALAHKLAVRLGDRFPRATLLEIHSHSLFSKWFSTSGKLVAALFQMVRDMVEDDPSGLVCVLIDEVESLASSRGGGNGGGDPGDAMRAVNSLLTSLDMLRSFPNVLVLATTNLTGSVDAAFVDRADLKLCVGLPVVKARYQILQSCLEELTRVGIITGGCDGDGDGGVDNQDPSESFLAFADAEKMEEVERQGESSSRTGGSEATGGSGGNQASRMLLECAQRSAGLSGRCLRKLPLQSHAQFLNGGGLGNEAVPLLLFLEALLLGIQAEQQARLDL